MVSALKWAGSTAIGTPLELLLEAVRGKLTNFLPVEAPAPGARRRPLAIAAAMAPSRRVVRRLLICRPPYGRTRRRGIAKSPNDGGRAASWHWTDVRARGGVEATAPAAAPAAADETSPSA